MRWQSLIQMDLLLFPLFNFHFIFNTTLTAFLYYHTSTRQRSNYKVLSTPQMDGVQDFRVFMVHNALLFHTSPWRRNCWIPSFLSALNTQAHALLLHTTVTRKKKKIPTATISHTPAYIFGSQCCQCGYLGNFKVYWKTPILQQESYFCIYFKSVCFVVRINCKNSPLATHLQSVTCHLCQLLHLDQFPL